MDLMLIIHLLNPLTFGLIVTEIGRLRFSKPVTLICAAGLVSLYVVLAWPVWDELTLIRQLIYALLLLGIIWLLIKDTPKRRLFFFAVYYLITMAADMSVAGFSVLFLGMENAYVAANCMAKYLGSALLPIFMMSYSTIFVAYYNKIEKSIRRRIVLLMLLLLISQSMFTVGMSWQSEELITPNMVLYAVVCEIICVLVQYTMFETINSSVSAVQDRMELENLRLKQEMDEKYIRMARENAQQMSVLRHDFQNQLQVAYALAEHQPEQAAAYMDEMEKKLEAVRPVRWCPNSIVNTILTIKAADAEKAGIHFTAEAGVTGWKLEETDLSSLFLNLLDNAIEGCQRSGCPNPEITLRAGERAGFYVVRVTNDCALDLNPDGGFATSKADSCHHGLGMNILRTIAKKYDGKLSVSVNDGRFEAKVILAAGEVVYARAKTEAAEENVTWDRTTFYSSSTYCAH